MKQGSGISYIHGLLTAENGAQLAARLRESSVSSLMHLLHAMFDGIDDSFFELANSARSNNEQNRYFEAMREVRIKRKGIEAYFQQDIARLFNTPPELRHNLTKGSVEEASLDGLALVQDDALEESVAINSMISKVRANAPGPLLQFQTRISVLYARDPNQSPVNPLDPEHLCKAFATACGALDIDIREKLIIYKQFDRYVLGNFAEILEEGNRKLIHAGVMPSLKPSAKRTPATPKSSNLPAEPVSAFAGHGAREDSEDLFPQLQALLANLRQSSGAGLNQDRLSSAARNARILSDQDLLHLLSGLQQRQLPDSLAEGPAETVSIRATIAALLLEQGNATGTPSSLNQIDEDSINLVSMLFEFILDDYNLSAPVQVLISRLQIPILKVAIKDKTFFSKTSHPARKLLNSLAKAGIGWSDISEKKRDKLYEQIHLVVQKILDDFNGDTTLFDELHQQFSSFLEREERKAKLVEQRTKEAEEGRVKSQKAQVVVDQILHEKISTPDLPPVAVDILRNGWSRVMFLAYLKDDTEHGWHHSLMIVDELIWCLQPHGSDQDRQRWVKVVPQLLKSLKAGLKEVSYNTSKLDLMLLELKQALTETFKRQSISAASASAPKPAPSTTAISLPTSGIKTGIERQKDLEDAATAVHLDKVDAITTGSWVEFSLVNGSKFRCKLSTKVDSNECYIFVNRMGLKVVEKTRLELAHEMRRGRIRVLEEGLLLDRAMHTIMSNLRKAAS